MVRTLKMYLLSKFQVHNTVLYAVVTRCILDPPNLPISHILPVLVVTTLIVLSLMSSSSIHVTANSRISRSHGWVIFCYMHDIYKYAIIDMYSSVWFHWILFVFLEFTELTEDIHFEFFIGQIADAHFFGVSYWEIIVFPWRCPVSLFFYIPCNLPLVFTYE